MISNPLCSMKVWRKNCLRNSRISKLNRNRNLHKTDSNNLQLNCKWFLVSVKLVVNVLNTTSYIRRNNNGYRMKHKNTYLSIYFYIYLLHEKNGRNSKSTQYTISAHQYLSQVTLYILHTLNALYLNITFCYLRSLYIHMLDPYVYILYIFFYKYLIF